MKENTEITLSFSLSEGFICQCSYNTRDIPKSAGFTYLPEQKKWQTWNFAKAKQLKQYADEKTKKFLNFYQNDLWQEIGKIRKAIKFLRDRCDYAHNKDHQGFSQSDRKLGWTLNDKPHWNQIDLAQAAFLVYKHRKQCGFLKKP